MTAVNSLSNPAAPGVEPRAYEPSMEEILASIRRIIADDQSLPGRAGAREPEPSIAAAEASAPHDQPPFEPVASEPVPSIHAVVSELTSAEVEAPRPVAHGPISAPQYASPEGPGANDPAMAHFTREPVHEDAPEAHAAAVEPEPCAAPVDETDSADTHGSEIWHDSRSAPETDAHRAPDTPAALFSNATDHSVTAAFNTLAATRLADNSDELLGLAREMIRPLLKTWLDDNLPSMVERMVRAEIERVARGSR